ncbi:hypothetical protein [Methylomonas methanica]|uniref:DUF922 domain-containing protein n=1 Tax=Methylomonas methanica (strain DSM 25384 / MC09) TaxID=857087 RepID=G0A274_METMM|nr:hypothetical protein [Methylomonas methanica]AEF98886.1 hypothetical protein Metme_0442 [Methylomonas methanica MC09]
MVWILISLFFCWLALREVKGAMVGRRGYGQAQPVYKPYLLVCLIFAGLFAWRPLHFWLLERQLSAIATQLADSRPAHFHCNTVLDAVFDNDPFAAGHASPETGEIVFQHPWCATLTDYLDHPETASRQELHSLNMLTHESMHVRGEMNEARTECQAVQRNYRTAKLLGVPDPVARKNAVEIYQVNYRQLSTAPDRVAAYFSAQCAPGKELDEQLSDSTWLWLEGQ